MGSGRTGLMDVEKMMRIPGVMLAVLLFALGLGVSGLPKGSAQDLIAGQLTGTGSEFLIVTASSEAEPGVYPLTLTGTDTIYAGNSSSKIVTLTVLRAP